MSRRCVISEPLTPARWRRVDELFAAAMELEPAAVPRFLDDACGDDAALRSEVEAMLRYQRASEDFLETPAIGAATEIWEDGRPTGGSGSSATAPATGGTQPRHAMDANARFIPGDVVAGRYRVVGLLGRGGMGEVYRADDLKLSQPVALKFLAESLSSNGAALARFHREVSLARQISHRHVCRVYDIGEHAGMHFLSMEYVRGEELSSLLKRIGRLPADKAVETARQLCAGLAAIHAAGVLHRDLKPANVMIDHHGDVRITDFGVAALSEGVSGREAMIGTPAYMAPEQLEGGELTTRSDIYALGLVLYEAFTGNRAFSATTLPEIVRDRLGDTPPTRPSTWVSDLDPLVERVVLRCLEKEPERRPATALQVAAALPGGDPLAAALAAGETPSPQMVAASSRVGSLRPRAAVLLLGSIIVSIVLSAWLADRFAFHRFVDLPQSPELLRARAADIAGEAGYTAKPRDTAASFSLDYAAFEYLRTQGDATRWERLRRLPLPALFFWYRSSGSPLIAGDGWAIEPADPPVDQPGMTTILLDPAGRLLSFQGVPPNDVATQNMAAVQSPATPRRADWNRFFERAGLNRNAFRAEEARATPPRHSDERLSWSGVHPLRPDLPLRVEAAAYRGVPVWFHVVLPWQTPTGEAQMPGEQGGNDFWIALVSLYCGVLALAVLLAWRNVRLGRGDRRGTYRLMLFIFLTRIVYWLAAAHHVAAAIEVLLFVEALKSALYWASLLGLLYLALEPFVRRRWPEQLISWSRLLAGDVRDPLVGRDFLIGGAFGVAGNLARDLPTTVPALLGRPLIAPTLGSPLLYNVGLDGASGFLPLMIIAIAGSLLFSLVILAVVLFFAMLTRRNAVAFGISWLLFYVVMKLSVQDSSVLTFVLMLAVPTIFIVVLVRYGLLSLVTMFFFVHFWTFFPVTTEVGAWYATPALMFAAMLVALSLFAFRVSLAGQKLMSGTLLE